MHATEGLRLPVQADIEIGLNTYLGKVGLKYSHTSIGRLFNLQDGTYILHTCWQAPFDLYLYEVNGIFVAGETAAGTVPGGSTADALQVLA